MSPYLVEPFPLHEELRAEPQPLFPGDVETSSRFPNRQAACERGRALAEGVGSVCEAGYSKYVVKGAGCERERYSEVV